jgi:SAM-dependent methyltransferase
MPLLEADGFCPTCNACSRFLSDSHWLREHFVCCNCGSIPRERALMVCIEMFYPQWRDLIIHEASPVERGTSRRLKTECPGYGTSFYDPRIPPGEFHPQHGYRCENLEALTLSDASLDLLITQDVFEHLFHPDRAIREIERVLKPGGAHIMTVPIVNKSRRSERRAELGAVGEIIYLKPPEYHGNPIDSRGALVTVDWGYDILDFLSSHSRLSCSLIYIDDLSRGIRAEFIEVVLCRKGATPCL